MLPTFLGRLVATRWNNTAYGLCVLPAKYETHNYSSTNLWLTDDEERLDNNVADHADAVGVNEAGVVGHDDGYVEGGDQDQPIPAGLEHAVVRQDEAGLLEGAGLVFGQRSVGGLQ